MAATPTNKKRRSGSRKGARGKVRPVKAPLRQRVREQLRFWGSTILILILLRTLLFGSYKIPSPSMEDGLLVGDFLIVSKLTYGARLPNTIGIPFTRVHIPGLVFPEVRLPGFRDPRRGDVIVFNYPAAQDVEGPPIPESLPTERRTPYIKRIVAVPGDTLAIVDKERFLNGLPAEERDVLRQWWTVHFEGVASLTPRQYEEADVELPDPRQVQAPEPRQVIVNATRAGAAALEAYPQVERVEPYVRTRGGTEAMVFPPGMSRGRDSALGYNIDQFGPLVIPGEGMTVRLTPAAWLAYRDIITRYEGREALMRSDGTVEVDGAPADTYTFEQDYFFVMGDNRDNSVDSRFWGFVPYSHIVGKASFVFMSFDGPVPRLSRFFNPIR